MSSTEWSLAPYLRISDAAKAIDFYIRAFGATERERYAMPNGKIGHAELDIHGNRLCLADADYTSAAASKSSYRDVPIMLYMSVPDVDTAFAQAVGAGGTQTRPPTDQEYGERNCGFVDPFGHHLVPVNALSQVAESPASFSGQQPRRGCCR
jgi:PhnB protein